MHRLALRRRYPRAFGAAQPLRGDADRSPRRVDRAFGVAPELRHPFGAGTGGIARPFLGVEREAQGLAIVALFDRGVRARERVGGRLDLLGRELIGAGGPGRFDGALRLIELFVGRLRARARREERGEDDAAEQARAATEHGAESIPMVKSLAPDDRPREKMRRLGPDALGDNELAAIVLGFGARRQSALELANALLGALGGLHGLPRATIDDLERIRGIGPVRAMQLVAAVELGRRTLSRPNAPREQLLTPRDAFAYLAPRFSARGIEQFGLILLDVRYRVIRATLLTSGGGTSAPVLPRDVFREAIAGRASAIVLFHNHPSGDPAPSSDDVHLTVSLVQSGELMGIEVVDHLVLADDRYYSFREKGLLPKFRRG